MLDTFVDKAWTCFNKISSAVERKPPDRKRKNKPKKFDSTTTAHDEIDDENGYDWICRPQKISSTTIQSGGTLSRSYIGAEKLPSPEKLEAAFIELLEELDLPIEKQKELQKQSAEKKWHMIIEQSNRRDQANCTSTISRLTEFASNFPDRYDWPLLSRRLEGLSISLRTESFSFVQDFLDSGGVELLITLLNEARIRDASNVAVPLLAAFRTLLNSTAVRTTILENQSALLSIAAALDFHNPKTKILTLEILSGLCLASESGHESVLKALTDARKLLGERTRFQRLIDDLHRTHGDSFRDTEKVRIALMSLINALLRSGPAENSIEFRAHLRHEFLMLGIQEVIDELRDIHGSAMEDHFDLFEMMKQEDEQEEFQSTSDSGASSPSLPDTPSEMAEELERKLATSAALPHYISLLRHLLLIPRNEKTTEIWKLFVLILQQISLQTSMKEFETSMDAGFEEVPFKLSVDTVISKLKTHLEFEKIEKEMQKMQKELIQERKKNLELENRIADLQEHDGFSINSFLRGGSDTSSNPSDPCPSSPLPSSSASATVSSNGIPECRPPIAMPPPPPPPSIKDLKSFGGFSTIPKKSYYPKPPHSMKALNWKILPAPKIKGTIFEKAEDEKMLKLIDLGSVAVEFASGKDGHDDKASTSGTLRRRGGTDCSMSILEPRRAQNCTIMLSKLKLSHREIRQAVLTMDEQSKIPKDMIEQMLKYIPTSDELVQIEEIVERLKSPSVLALADRYFYEIGKIPRFEQRLRCLNAIRSFQERIEIITSYANAVLKASTSVQTSKKLKQFVSLVLALGNYLNHSKHNGNASGFMVESFRALTDVRSNLRHDMNLLHFIIRILDSKLPEVLKISKEIGTVFEAAKFSRSEMETEIKAIQESLKEISNELTAQKTKAPATTSVSESAIIDPKPAATAVTSKSDSMVIKCKGDRFVEVVEGFLSQSQKQMHEIEKLTGEMSKKFSSCVQYFGEDPIKASPDEFFGHFCKLLTQFSECQTFLWELKEEEERQKRQTIAKSFFAKKTRRSPRNGTSNGGGHGNPRDPRNRDFEKLIDAIQSGDIFSEDLTRLRTSFRIPKRKSIRRS